nr:MAG TPA: hypothetical protein [Caudoviricetes sp.]
MNTFGGLEYYLSLPISELYEITKEVAKINGK